MNREVQQSKHQALLRDIAQHICPLAVEIEKLRALVLADTVTRLPQWLARCREVFDGFKRCVREHIGYEQAVDAHRRLAEAAPDVRARVCELEEEHVRILAECATIDARLQAVSASATDSARLIVRHLENVIAIFRRHTAAELALVYEVFGAEPSSAEARTLTDRPCLFDDTST